MPVESIILLVSFLLPIALFAYVGLIRASALAPPEKNADIVSDELLLASRSATPADFKDSSVAYMLQVSTTVYFVFWGYHYGFANVFYMLSWGIGLYIFSLFVSRLDIIRSQFETVPALIAGPHHVGIRRLAAFTTIIGFIGVVYVETYFATEFITTIVYPPERESGSSSGTVFWWIVFLMLITTCLTYSCIGGLRKVFVTDKYQLGLGYLGLTGALVYALSVAGGRTSSGAVITGTVALVVFCILLIENLWRRQTDFKVACLLISAVAIAIVTFVIEFPQESSSDIGIPGVFAQVSQPLGWVTLLGFTVLNLLWQFCDSSNYQRIAAISLGAIAKPCT